MLSARKKMEEKKIDGKTILGFVLITGLMLWMMYNNISDEKKSMAEDTKKAKTEKVEQAKQQAIPEQRGSHPLPQPRLPAPDIEAQAGGPA